jgi:integron integrase
MNASSPAAATNPAPHQPKLLDQLTVVMQRQRYLPATIQAYRACIHRYIHFHGLRHPRELGAAEAGAFLDHLAMEQKASLSAQAAARNALLLLYSDVLQQALGDIPVARLRAGSDLAQQTFGHLESCPDATPTRQPKLLDQVREVLRARQYALNTEECYLNWIRRFILFHDKRHPRDMGKIEVELFLTHLAAQRDVSISTQRQAMNALLFLYQRVLQVELGWLDAVRAKRQPRLPVVMSREEVRLVLSGVTGAEGLYALVAELLYGTGMRIDECCSLRVKDIDLGRGQITVFGKGNKDRVVMLPRTVCEPLEQHLADRRALHEQDVRRGVAWVPLPDALARKYPQAPRELGWQYCFASRQLSRDPRSGNIGRHHVCEGGLSRAIKAAVRQAGLTKHVTAHTFRHSFATHLLEMGYDIRTVQTLLGHKDVETTMIYTHVMQRGVAGVTSPLDVLRATPEEVQAAVDATRRLVGAGLR